jgi:adenylyltransferase/sulfurtransferase
MNPKRIAVKIFTSDPEAGVDLDPFIPFFHRVIQQGAFEGLLVDVADYIHVPNGPGVVLVGHDVDYGIDSVGGRTGLLTVRKRAGETPLGELLLDTLRRALSAARSIEEDGSVAVSFDPSAIEISILDRLAAGNDDAGFEAARADVEAVASRLFGDGVSVDRGAADDPRKALTFRARSAEAVDLKTLLDRVGAPARATAADVPGPAVPGQSDWDISVEQLKHLRDSGADFVLVDVREQHEVEICEIGGQLIPLGQLGERMSELKTEDHIVVHCHMGGRSAAAVKALRDAGFGNAWNVQGGIRAWIQRIDSSLNDY